jgi:RimJ/RimL family protein N-acetyltransferase
VNHVPIETARLIIRPFVSGDLLVINRILDQEFGDAGNDRAALQDPRSWLEWQILNQEWFKRMRQPPYGDLAITLKEDNQVIGAAGYVPCLAPFEQIPELRGASQPSGYYTTEFGLFYAIDPEYRRRGYATEAARAMLENAFRQLHVRRVIAMTDYSNLASQNVMRKLGMKATRNPLPEPRWIQIVGVLGNSGD